MSDNSGVFSLSVGVKHSGFNSKADGKGYEDSVRHEYDIFSGKVTSTITVSFGKIETIAFGTSSPGPSPDLAKFGGVKIDFFSQGNKGLMIGGTLDVLNTGVGIRFGVGTEDLNLYVEPQVNYGKIYDYLPENPLSWGSYRQNYYDPTLEHSHHYWGGPDNLYGPALDHSSRFRGITTDQRIDIPNSLIDAVSTLGPMRGSYDHNGDYRIDRIDPVTGKIDSPDNFSEGVRDVVDAVGDWSGLWPVILDLDGDGLEISLQYESSTFFDFDGDGYSEQTAWVGKDDGILVIDLDDNDDDDVYGDGVIDQVREIAFTEWLPEDQREGNTDLSALAEVFDSNTDGVFNQNDARWSEFRIWNDVNLDGEVDTGELKTLGQQDISEIALTYTNGANFGDASNNITVFGNTLHGIASFTKTDGTVNEAGDAMLLHADRGWRRVETSTGFALELELGRSLDYSVVSEEGGTDVTLSNSDAGAFGDARLNRLDAVGVDGNVILDGGDGNDILIGGSYHDMIFGGSGADELRGGAGSDVLYFDSADTLVDGGAGYDVALVADDVAVSFDLSVGEIEAAYGGSGNDMLSAGAENTTAVILEGREGNDLLTGGMGDDLLSGDEGDDTIDGGAGRDLVFGGSGDDSLIGALGDDILSGGTENDTLTGGAGDDVLNGDDGIDILYGNDGQDFLNGGLGDDFKLEGGLGSDVYVYGRGDGTDTIFEAGGHFDTLRFSFSVDPSDLRLRLGGDDLIVHLADEDGTFSDGSSTPDAGVVVTDWALQDNRIEYLEFADGTKHRIGNMRFDTTFAPIASNMVSRQFPIDWVYSLSEIDFEAALGPDGLGGIEPDDITSAEGWVGYVSEIDFDLGADSLWDGGPSDKFAGVYTATLNIDEAGTYTFYSGSDDGSMLFVNDTLVVNNDGNHAYDTVWGAIQLTAGQHDFAYYYYEHDGDAAAKVEVQGPGLTKQVLSAASLYIEADSATTTGSAGDDFIVGQVSDETIHGGSGNDYIAGGDGLDHLHGESGDDTLDAGANDSNQSQLLFGGDGNDTYVFDKTNGKVFIGVSAEGAATGDADRVLFADLSLRDVTFSYYDYTQDGNPATDASGKALVANWDDGTDTGSLTIANMGEHIERFEFADGSVLSKVDADFLIQDDPITYSDRFDDKVWGTDGDDVIFGSGDSETIYGGDGNDTLHAGGHSNNMQYLHGEGGDDLYLYSQESGRVFISSSAETVNGGTDTVRFTDLALADLAVDVVDYSTVGNAPAEGRALRLQWDENGETGELQIALGGEHIERYEFAFSDGTVLGRIEADYHDTNPNTPDDLPDDRLWGTDEDNIINGSGDVEAIFGGDGNDTLDAGGTSDATKYQLLYGQEGDDTYVYGKASGNVFISLLSESADTGTDTVRFSDLALSDLTLDIFDYSSSSSPELGRTLRMKWNDGVDFGELRVALEGTHIERFEFADGSTLSSIDANYMQVTHPQMYDDHSRDKLWGTDGDDLIVGTNDIEQITGGDGNDTLDAGGTTDSGQWQRLYGHEGDDTYQYGKASGQVFIDHTAESATTGTADRLVFTDLDLADVTFSVHDYSSSSSPENGSVLGFNWNDGADSAEVFVANMGEHIESFEFADGRQFDAVTATADVGSATTAGSGNDLLIGGAGADIINAGAGDDFLEAGSSDGSTQYLRGNAGDDTYRYGTGDGSVYIGSVAEVTDGGTDTVIFRDLNVSDLAIDSFTHSNTAEGDVLRFTWTQGSESGKLRIANLGEQIERFEFADGTTMTYDEFLA